MASMADRLNRTTTAWRPEPGDIVTGRVVDVETFEGSSAPIPS